jgi:hypothetical protein
MPAVIPKALVFAVVAASRVAAAEPKPVDLNIGLGVTEQRWSDVDIDQDSDGFKVDAVLYVQIGVPVYRDLVVMVHGSATAPKILSAVHVTPVSGQTVPAPFRYLPLEFGIGAEYTFPYDIWASPWVGLEKLAAWNDLPGDVTNPTSFAFGFEAGIDLYQDDTGSRTGLFLKTTLMPHIHSSAESSYFLQIAAGIAYRFR